MFSKLQTAGLRKFLVAAFAVTAAPLPASASYFNYAAWSDLPETSRAMYITGAFDSFIAYSGPSSLLPRHYTGCLYDLRINGEQLAENLHAFVQTRPTLSKGSVQIALDQYLQNTCGTPPPRSTM